MFCVLQISKKTKLQVSAVIIVSKQFLKYNVNIIIQHNKLYCFFTIYNMWQLNFLFNSNMLQWQRKVLPRNSQQNGIRNPLPEMESAGEHLLINLFI